MLQFRHHTCARGRTVEKSFLVDLATALGIANPSRRTKDALLGAIFTAATGEVSPPLGHPGSIYSRGSTVTDDALQRIIDGVRERDLAKVSLVDGAPATRIAMAAARTEEPDPFQRLAVSDVRKDELRAAAAQLEELEFRDLVLAAYGTRCAITRCDVQEALEAAVIDPAYEPRYAVTNGICLRADLRRLWDAGRLAVHEATHTVMLNENMIGTEYGLDVGMQIRAPENARDVPSSVALQRHREWCDL
ncbi:MAG TPA: HNH endonuclease signature motif containing protein [Frankiaceae bacterium]|nr:HNH endonuclease signature motif containing protein [Frankiaceae bacterium]